MSAEAGPTIERIQVGFGEGGGLKIATWTPVWAHLRGGTAPFSGILEIAAPDDQGMPTVMRAPVKLPAGQALVVQSLIRAGIPKAEIELRLVDKSGRALTRPVIYKPSAEIGWNAQLVLRVGPASGLEGVVDLPKFAGVDTSDRLVGFAPLDDWPADPLGFDAASAIALSSEDSRVIAALRDGGAEVLRTWVARGGHLVISMGARWSEVVPLLGDLLPARPVGMLSLTDVGAIETLAGSVSPPLRGPTNITKLEANEGDRHVVLAIAQGSPLVVRKSYGFGRVTLTGIDLANGPVANWANRTLIWDKLMDLRGRMHDVTAQVSDTRGALIEAERGEIASRIHRGLEQFPSVVLIPFGWVAFLIFVYLILIGPIDYFFLKRIVRRMELTWLTFPAIVLASTLGVYAAAYSLKGSSPRVNKLDLLDFDQTTELVRGTSWWTYYSVANRDIGNSLQPLPPDLRTATAWQPDPTRTATWFAHGEPVLVGLGQVALGTRRASYEPPGAVERLEGVRVPIWSTRSFTGRWWGRAKGVRVIEADLRVVAGDRITGSIRNLLDQPMKKAQLFYGRNVYDLGTIRPRGIARVDFSKAESIARSLGRVLQRSDRRLDAGESTSQPESAVTSADLLRAALFHDALGSRADAYPNRVLAGLDLTAQAVELSRPMLIGEVDAPAAALELSGEPNKPSTEQSTIVRVILDLSGPNE